MEDSILITIKQMLGIEADTNAFDVDVLVNTNSAMMTLNQLGVGPAKGFRVVDPSTTWKDLLGERIDLDASKLFVYLTVRLAFDPPQNSFLVKTIEEQLKELAFRLNVQAENQEVI